MQTTTWHPVSPSHFVRAGDNIVAGFAHGQELALWRSRDGTVQAWENRCPHRGTRLTLGRVINDHLSCAYHGWEFSPQANCVAVPANPDLPVPKQVRVRTFAAAESDGMIWVALTEPEQMIEVRDELGLSDERQFARTLAVRCSIEDAIEVLRDRGFENIRPGTWRGQLADTPVTILLNAGSSTVTQAHVWLSEPPAKGETARVLAQSQLLRRDIEDRAPYWSQS